MSGPSISRAELVRIVREAGATRPEIVDAVVGAARSADAVAVGDDHIEGCPCPAYALHPWPFSYHQHFDGPAFDRLMRQRFDRRGKFVVTVTDPKEPNDD